ncbi:MAG: hypothetical protein ACRBFS_06400 [Aureispira sp.]
MKSKESIYIVKGKGKSALINLGTQEIRSISNAQLNQLSDNITFEEDLSAYLFPTINAYQKEILDLRLSKIKNFEKMLKVLDDSIKTGTVYLNVRIFCPNEDPISLKEIQTLITWINETIFHFGIVVVIPEHYNKELFYKEFSAYRVILKKKPTAKTAIYQPVFRVSPNAIHVSKNNNLYHYSRDTIVIEENDIQLIDHDQFNVPKSNIENCKDCAFRLTCFDLRKVFQEGEKYYYNSTCQYELDD